MEWFEALFFLLGMILFFMFLGMPVALAFLAANVIGAVVVWGGRGSIDVQIFRGIVTVANNGLEAVTKFSIMPVPMFLLMGELFFFTGLASRMIIAIDRVMGRMPARLSLVTVAGGTGFAALSGSSMGSTALLGNLMVPEMQKRGYKKHMAIGPILGTGGLAMLIPPSALAVLLATNADLNIGDLLAAGILPGLILAILYVILILGMAKLDPKAAPYFEVETVSVSDAFWLIMTSIVPMVGVIVVVIALILSGVSTPSESAAFGCWAVVILALIYRTLTWDSIVKSVTGALKVSTMALLIIFGSATFSKILAYSKASSGLITWATSFELDPTTMLLVMFLILLVLGMFMDQLSMMLLTVPIFFPLAQTLGFDLIWFAVIMLMAMEISFTTPPFGLLLFVMKGVSPPDTKMRDIYVAALPFIGCSIILVVLLIAFPQVALWLPNFWK